MHRQEPASRPRWRTEVGRLLALFGATGLAIAQPVLDAFGKSPETFIFRDADGADLLVFAAVIVAAPPLALWAIGLAVGQLVPRARMLLHGATVGVLVGLAVAQVAAGLPLAVTVLSSAALGLVAWVLTTRAAAFRMWSQLLAGLPALALLSFALLSPSSGLVTGGEFDPAEAHAGTAPVVLVVLDELPTASIIDGDGRIDAVRFPNLARLASESTWYRNHTTVAGFTTSAVPAILTGNVPEGGPPLFTTHPDNLFRLLAGSHDLVVSESITRLCPASVCGDRPTAPGAPVQADAAGAQMGALLRSAADLWWERVSGADEGVDFGVFEPGDTAPSGQVDPFREEAAGSAAEWSAEAMGGEPARLAEWLEALRPGERPVAAVLHLVSPHFPWRRLPDGTVYVAPAERADLAINGGNGGVPWIQDLERQRHLLQASYTDALLGQVLEHLEEVGIYDEAAVVVTADHGVAFHGPQNRRVPVESAHPELLWTPLLVKAPGQRAASVDDTNVQTIDIVPTIADLIGVDLPWSVDGLAAGSDAQRERGPTKVLRRFDSGPDPDPPARMEVDGDGGFRAMLAMPFPTIGPGDDLLDGLYRLTDLGGLVGQPFQPTGEVDGDTFEVDELDRMLRTFERPFVVTGTVRGGRVDEDAVVAVADGRIVAVSPVVFRNIGGAAFALLLPPDGSAGLGELRLALLRDGEILDAGEIA